MAPKIPDELQKAVEQKAGGPVEVEGEGKCYVLMSADVYRALFGDLPDDDRDYAQCVAGIRRGLKSMEQGEDVPLEEAFEAVRRKHNIPADA
jgi:hypothetical protein